MKADKPQNQPEKMVGVGRQALISIFTGKEKAALIENLTLLLAAGLNITAAIEAVEEELKSRQLKKVIRMIRSDVESGSTLWRALTRAKIFDPATIALVRVGEETGRLSDNLKIVSEQNEKTKSFRSKIRSALMYPVFVMIIAFVVAIGVAWFILPNLATVFSQMDVELPAITKALIGFGQFLRAQGKIFLPSFILAISLLASLVFFNRRTKFIGQSIFFIVPGIGDLIMEVELGRFGYLLGTLLKAGIPIEEALESVAGAADFFRYRRLALHLRGKIMEGDSFQKGFSSFRRAKSIVPRPVQQMIIAGEKSGNLADILLKIGRIYEEKTELTTKDLVTILEPVLLIIVWLGVVGVALSIILPIYSLIGNLNAQY